MSAEIIIYVCDTALEAETAKQILIEGGYAAASITLEQAGVVSYDAKTYGDGACDVQEGKIVVTGRR